MAAVEFSNSNLASVFLAHGFFLSDPVHFVLFFKPVFASAQVPSLSSRVKIFLPGGFTILPVVVQLDPQNTK